ncbi:cell wall metabolism sensor histidine kinase WalK, partial [uncultured Nocardioides sp.]
MRLQEVNRVKQDLVSTVSHELRTPITSIHGYTERRDGAFGDLTAAQIDAVERVRHNSSRLEALVNDLLVLERAEIGNLDLEFGSLDLRETVHGVTHACEEMLEGRTLDVDLDLASTPVPVYGDRVAMERVLVNLLSNAVKFTPRGEVVLGERLDEAGALVFAVRDTGIGIPADRVDRLFRSFSQVDASTTRVYGGTG